MRLDVNKLSSAVRLALSLGAVATAGSVTAVAQDSSGNKNQSLETIVVTGSNIRRVDIETANPVVTVDRAAIEKSGKVTLGDLIQQLPSMAGAATNTNVNNGGGTGAATISLRGLGTQRSLLLINGHRVATQLQDLNMIPAAAVERIEVLTEGASTVYGSDAVAGVVNVITRTNYQGAEFEADYGISDHDDGERQGYRFLFGQSTEKGSLMAGVNYNHQDPVAAANRKYSKDALYLYKGVITAGGSPSIPNGNIQLPSTLNSHFGCTPNSAGNISVTRKDGATGTALTDYRCVTGADSFNFQAVGNYDVTPSERTGAFAMGNYKLTENVETYLEFFHNKTTSRSQVAPLPLNLQADSIVLSKNSFYNPFGVDFGKDTTGTFFSLKARLSTLGTRIADFSTTHDLVTTGFKGNFGESSWSWNVDFSYGHFSQEQHQFGFLNTQALKNSIGPSFKNPATGAIVCGTPGAIIAGCTPINLFDLNDPNTIAGLKSVSSNPFTHLLYQTKQEEASVSGTLFDLPAGPLSLAVGATHRKEYEDQQVDATIAGHLDSSNTLVCSLSNSICSSNTQGSYSLREGFAELLIPVLKDLPFAHSLNVDVGDRYSKYSNFGSTNNWKVALEYRPIEDLLLRGTVSKVFRAPLISDIFGGPLGSSPTASDPCVGLVGTNAACQHVKGDGTFKSTTGSGQVSAVTAGSNFFGGSLSPEHGKSFDYGFVYDPHWIDGLSLSADVYKITLQNLIVSGGTAQFILNSCFNANGGPLCNNIVRIADGPSAGQIQEILQPTINAGSLETKGADFGIHYRLPETGFGHFNATLQGTYIDSYDVNNGVSTQGIAGHFDRTFGNFARWRGLGSLDWNLGPWNATWTARYIGKTTIGHANAGLGSSADGAGYGNYPSIVHYGSYTYHDLSLGYNIEPINTLVQLGVNNVGDKTPPIYFFNNVANANTDVNTYDTIGRFYFASLIVKF
jgi:iron complex outermembrane receptor protein